MSALRIESADSWHTMPAAPPLYAIVSPKTPAKAGPHVKNPPPMPPSV